MIPSETFFAASAAASSPAVLYVQQGCPIL